MFDRAKAEGRWWDDGWQLVTGCTQVSAGCDNCWALSMNRRFGEADKVVFHADRLGRPIRRKKPTVYAIWNDLFHVDHDDIMRTMDVIQKCPHHLFLVLTKRPQRMYEFFAGESGAGLDAPPLPNLWLGVTAENQAMANERIRALLKIPAAKRFVSVEPMLGPVKPILAKAYCDRCDISVSSGYPWAATLGNCVYCKGCGWAFEDVQTLDWVICGGETGHGAREMNPAWARTLRDQCNRAGVPFFFKQMTSKAKIPKDLMIREIPTYYTRATDGTEGIE
jgi:protein gp37